MNSNRTLFIPFGAPNSGKGTLMEAAERTVIAQFLGAGNICRDEKKSNSTMWQQAARYMEEHESTLWPTDLMFQAFQMRFEGVAYASPFHFADGILRRPDQVEEILGLAQEFHFNRIVLIEVDTPRDECIRRASERGRPDDAHIVRRMDEYQLMTVPAADKLLAAGFPTNKITLDGTLVRDKGHLYVTSLATLYGMTVKEGVLA